MLEIEAIGEGSNANKGVVNLGISKEEVTKTAMEIQAESLEVTTSILENIDIPIEQKKVFQQYGEIPTRSKPRRK